MAKWEWPNASLCHAYLRKLLQIKCKEKIFNYVWQNKYLFPPNLYDDLHLHTSIWQPLTIS